MSIEGKPAATLAHDQILGSPFLNLSSSDMGTTSVCGLMHKCLNAFVAGGIDRLGVFVWIYVCTGMLKGDEGSRLTITLQRAAPQQVLYLCIPAFVFIHPCIRVCAYYSCLSVCEQVHVCPSHCKLQ